MSKEKLYLNKNFILLTMGNITTKLGTKIYEIILAWWLVQKTGSAATFGVIMASSLISVVICNIFSGVIIDRFNKKFILILSDLISAVVCIFVGIVVMNDVLNIPLLMVAAIILGATNSLFSPSIKAILPELINKKLIVSANSITTVIGQVITVAAPLIGGFLISGLAVGLGIGFIINGISYLLSATSEMFIKYKYVRESKGNLNVFADIKEGYSYVFQQKWLFQLLIVSALFNLFISAYNINLPLYYLNIYNDDGTYYSLALGAQATFAILAGLLIAKRNKKAANPALLKQQLLFCGIPIVLLQFVSISYLSILLVGFFAFFLTTFNVYFFSLVQQEVDRDKSGRVFSFIFMVALSIMPLGTLIFGLLSTKIFDVVFILSGVGIILSTLIVKSSHINLNHNLQKSI
ncbi:MFS family permease [Bacillus mesophilus]|uniref:MFS transporter n=1 Tax=Bacillus mesophilus TaxID=1808955 RepID=A0A6M0QBE4_9BACI|nr:MFS transporter [Bacillus mesophilus]MBM7662288.1 MFS family permease [Bacillus mesophilus]NEY73079.1 MFS transporter [Bacillus mesophilus]